MVRKHKIVVKNCGFISDIQNRPELALVTDSQDVRAVKEMLGFGKELKELEEFGGLFVKVGEGEYTEVYGFHGSVPDLGKRLYCLQSVFTEKGKVVQEDQVCKCPE